MEPLVQLAHSVSPTAAGLLLASVWQGALLTAGVALILSLVRSVSPAARTWIWTAVSVLVLLLPVLALEMPHATVGNGQAELHVAQSWSVALLALWAALSMYRAGQLAVNGLRLWGIARRAHTVVVDAPIAELLQGSRQAHLCVSSEVNRPSVAGFLRPRVLLPEGLLESLSQAELAHVVLHEMEHLRRYDDWLNLLQQVSLLLLPLNPALIWLDRRLNRERELACDDGVLAATQSRKAYAACLVKLAEDSLLRKGVALALSALGTRARQSELVGRVRRILAAPECGAQARRAPFAASAVALIAVAATGLLARSPQWISFDGETASTLQTATLVHSTELKQVLPSGPRMVNAAFVSHGSGAYRAAGAQPKMEQVFLTTGLSARRAELPVMAHRRTKVRSLSSSAARTGLMHASEPVQRRVSAPDSRMVMTEFEVSQPVYAAVPWQGGWLIVQL